MHKTYVNVSPNVSFDYVPDDHIICKRCYFYEICPLTYRCKSLERCIEHENLVDDDTN